MSLGGIYTLFRGRSVNRSPCADDEVGPLLIGLWGNYHALQTCDLDEFMCDETSKGIAVAALRAS